MSIGAPQPGQADGVSRLKRPNPEAGHLQEERPLPASRRPCGPGPTAHWPFLEESLDGAALGSSPEKPFSKDHDLSEI